MYSWFVRNISFPIITKRDGLPGVMRHLSQLQESQYWPRDKIVELQLERLKAILTHAYENTDFYKKRFSDAGFNPLDFKNLDQMRSIPVLTKKDLQEHLPSLVALNLKQEELHKDATGGSTGIHTPFFRDNKCRSFKRAVEFRCNHWAGWKIGQKIAYYWPAIQDFAKRRKLRTKFKNSLSYRSLMLYSGKLDEETLSKHYEALAKFRPSTMRVFPNPLSILAEYIKATNRQTIHIPSIISVGEPLLESQRRLFSEIFGARIFNCYVSRECGNMACECGDKTNHLHMNSEMVYMEFGDNDENTECRPEKILLTDLVNYGMPFIRYQIEDLGTPVKEECKCGRGLPLMRMDAGRASDFLISPHDGSRVSGSSFLHHLVAEGPDVGQIQVLQDKIDHLRLKILKSKSFSEDKLSHFDKVIEAIFKGLMHYDIEYVDKISREKSGKYLFTKCLL